MATVRDLIKGALRPIGVLASGETLSAEDQADALSVLNNMIESWSIEGLSIPYITREEFTLTSNDGSYTIGSSGDFNTTRPIRIEKAKIEDQSQSPTAEYPLDIITSKEWADIITKDLSSDFPQKLYYESTYPLGTIKLYPVPSTANKLVLYTEKALTAFASANTSVLLPEGYFEALRLNLAVRIAPEYGKEASSTVIGLALEAKANVKRKNIKPSYLQADFMIRGSKHYNIYVGE